MGMMLRQRHRKKAKAKAKAVPKEELQLQPVVETEVKKRGPHKQTKT